VFLVKGHLPHESLTKDKQERREEKVTKEEKMSLANYKQEIPTI